MHLSGIISSSFTALVVAATLSYAPFAVAARDAELIETLETSPDFPDFRFALAAYLERPDREVIAEFLPERLQLSFSNHESTYERAELNAIDWALSLSDRSLADFDLEFATALPKVKDYLFQQISESTDEPNSGGLDFLRRARLRLICGVADRIFEVMKRMPEYHELKFSIAALLDQAGKETAMEFLPQAYLRSYQRRPELFESDGLNATEWLMRRNQQSMLSFLPEGFHVNTFFFEHESDIAMRIQIRLLLDIETRSGMRPPVDFRSSLGAGAPLDRILPNRAALNSRYYVDEYLRRAHGAESAARRRRCERFVQAGPVFPFGN